MPAAARFLSGFSSRLIIAIVLAGGGFISVVWYQHGRVEEQERARALFVQRAAQRHALAVEILSRFEDTLFGLSALFMLDGGVTRNEFLRATTRLEQRISGAQAFEWVPLVPAENRAAVETTLLRLYPRLKPEIFELGPGGVRQRAAERPAYFPILYVQPQRGNEAALGYDLGVGPTSAFLQRARETRQMMLTHQVKLVQETRDQQGVVMIWPVWRTVRPAGATADEEVFMGFLQCVFRVHDLLETVHSRQPNTMLDMLFIDASETDPARRLLYYRPADAVPRAGRVPSEAEFAEGMIHEIRLPFGGRDWRVLFRPRAGWVEQQLTATPLLRSGSILLVSLLVAGLVHLNARRTETIRREVQLRTAELGESRRQLASLLHELPGMAYRGTYDDQLALQFVSEGAFALTGWTAEEFIGGAVHYRDCIHPDDVARVREATRNALAARKDVEVEYRIRTKEGAEKWVLARGHGVFAPEGNLQAFEGLVIDVTAQKQAEQARLELERRLLEGQKLESLGLLAGGIAHDFNNLLSTILGNANLARMALPADAAIDPQLQAIEHASLRAAELCRQMLAYAGKGRFIIEPTDLTALAEELLPLLKISIAHHARLQLELARPLPLVLADATQLRQIVMNLVLNAADAIQASSRATAGEITLTTGVMHATHDFLLDCVAGAGLARGDYVFLEVCDNGCGMAPHVLAKIFDPFFTTKFAGRGLGLAATLGIVRGHKGALRVESREGEGARFRLLLPPATPASQASEPKPAAPTGHWSHRGRVLLIEDEAPVRRVTAEILRTFGLEVHEAPDGERGLEVFRTEPAAFDLVVLDLLMPGLGGERTLAELRAVRADVRVLLVSGYSESNLLDRLAGEGRLGYLGKPFTRAALEQKLREMVDGEGERD
jgi:PAS domain S-box-containing protein